MTFEFFFIGPIRSGTTWIHELLKQYEQIKLPVDPIKETFFFDQYFYKGFSWYKKFFPNTQTGNFLYGEVAPTYFISEEACRRIKVHNPHAKIFVNKRDTEELKKSIEKHYSRYKLYNTKLDNYRSPEEFLKFDKYYDLWRSTFEEVVIIDFYDIANQPKKVKRIIEDTLGVGQPDIVIPGKTNESKDKSSSFYFDSVSNRIFSKLRNEQHFRILNMLRKVNELLFKVKK